MQDISPIILLFQPRFQSRRNKLTEYTEPVTVLFTYVCESLVITYGLLKPLQLLFSELPQAKSNPAMEFFCVCKQKIIINEYQPPSNSNSFQLLILYEARTLLHALSQLETPSKHVVFRAASLIVLPDKSVFFC